MKTATVRASAHRPRCVDWSTSAALHMDKRALPNLSAKASAALLKDSQRALAKAAGLKILP